MATVRPTTPRPSRSAGHPSARSSAVDQRDGAQSGALWLDVDSRAIAAAKTSRSLAPAGRGRFSTWKSLALETRWNSAVTSYYLLIGATVLLLLLGLVMVLSSSTVESIAAGQSPYAQFANQTRFAVIGTIGLLLAMRISPLWYQRLAWPALIGAMGLQSLTFIPALSLSAGGNTGWIGFGNFTMQPAEVGKVALAVWLGWALGRNQYRIHEPRYVLGPVIGAGAVIALVLIGKDLGTAIIVAAIAAGALFVAGVPAKLLAIGGVSASAFIGYVFIFAQANSNRLNRIFAVFDPNCDVNSLCYQTQHGMYALGTGGIFGMGLGASREKWRYLPEAHNDFIFAIIGEELGLFGTLLVLALFVVLGIAMVRVIRRHRDPFVKITTAGVACWIVGQAFINMGVVLGVFPVIGLPLPLVSAGGSALVMTMAALGMVISFARTEPGAAEVLAARRSVVKRSFATLAARRAAVALQ